MKLINGLYLGIGVASAGLVIRKLLKDRKQEKEIASTMEESTRRTEEAIKMAEKDIQEMREMSALLRSMINK